MVLARIFFDHLLHRLLVASLDNPHLFLHITDIADFPRVFNPPNFNWSIICPNVEYESGNRFVTLLSGTNYEN